MRTNRYSSAADARRQRRYERIQQRKDDERRRRGIECEDDACEMFIGAGFDLNSISASSQTYMIALPIDAPNANRTVITQDAARRAVDKYNSRANNRSTEMATEEINVAVTRAIDELYERIRQEAWEEFVFGQATSQDVADEYVALYNIIDNDLVPFEDPEPELIAGNNDEIDSFLETFSHLDPSF